MKKNPLKSKKVAIIGAGIIGLYLAWKLSEKGHKVTVFEKKKKIGKEACSGLFSERILKFIPESEKLIQNQINSALIHFSKKTINIKFSQRFLVMSHAELDRLTAGLAQNAGAQIKLNSNVTLPDPVTVFDKMIGCDGTNSIVRKHLRMPEPNKRLGILGFVPQEDSSSYVETWPVTPHQGQGLGRGFIWKIPRGKELELGIIAKPEKAQKIFKDFLKKKNIKLEKIKSAVVPQGFLMPKNSKITLCGDAVGLTKPWSGGGVIWGLVSAEILLKNFPDFLAYHREMKNFFLPRVVF